MRMSLKAIWLPIFLPMVLSAGALGQGAGSDLPSMCDDLTPSNVAMAKSAGYDVDALCNQIKTVAGSEPDQREVTTLDSRKTVSSVDSGPTQGADISVEPSSVVSIARQLKPFGYDIFAGSPKTFAPVTDIPVSPDYLLGPGDTLEILLYGKINSTLSLEITRDGSINLSGLGPVTLAGLSFAEAKAMLQTRIATQMIGVQASISLGELRSMQIFVLGEAYRAGAYTVSSLSTITHALFVSGGVSDIASLRNIQLKRAGQVVATLDLYDLLMRGDTGSDVRLQSSDVIYIPTVGDLVSIDGAVLRPAIYELKAGERVDDLITMAGGLKAKASVGSARVDRLDGNGFTTVVDVDLDQADSRQMVLKAGDFLQVDRISDRKKKIVTLSGHVDHPGDYAWTPGLRISDVIGTVEYLRPLVDLNFALLVRELPPVGAIKTLAVDLRSILIQPGGQADYELSPRDKLHIFSTDAARVLELAQLVGVLKRQSREGELAKVASIAGGIRFPGIYPLTENMSMQQLVLAAGGLVEGAFKESVEISRVDMSDPNSATLNTSTVSLARSSGAFKLMPYDEVLVRIVPEYRGKNVIALKGEVVFPGEYVFQRGDTLLNLIARAGGVTEYADVNAAVFTREALRKAEVKALEGLRVRLEQLLVEEQLSASLEETSAEAMSIQAEALSQLDSVDALGRLVIPLQAIIDKQENDIIVAPQDSLTIPQFRQEVTVVGEVQRPTSHMFRRGSQLRDYVDMSGGLKATADKRAMYVIKASGEVILPRKGFLRFKTLNQIAPGDTIVVPLDPDGRVKVLPLISDVTRILYELALGAAAVNSFNNP